MANDTLFRAKAPGIMNLLMADFPWGVEDSAAALGNIGHECNGFLSMQEQGVSTRGGWGWPQFTGPRRDAFEAYCARHGYDPASDTANYKYMFVELKGSERAAIPAVKNAIGLEGKVRAFEMTYERAGVKAYDSRLRWANIALEAYHANPGGRLDIQDAGTSGQVSKLPPPPLNTGTATASPINPLVAAGGYLLAHPDEVKSALHMFAGIHNAAHPDQPIQIGLPTIPTTPAKTDSLVHPPSILAGGLAFVTGLIAQLNGNIAPPVGDHATLPGILTTVLPIALTVLGGPAAGVGSKLLQGLASYIATKAKP